jgi:alpha-ketoglutarate-dependent taurine dioxygenase
MATTLRELTPAIGTEITGLSGHDFVDELVAKELLALLEQRGVLVYRGANIADPDLVALSRLLGEVVIAKMGSDPNYPEVSPISLDPAKSDLASYRAGTFYWHIDGANDLVPQKATLLAAREVAESGGDTEFANLYAAYEALPADEKTVAERTRVVHSFAATQRLVYPDPSPKRRAGWDTVPSREHPLIWTRPDGRKSLLVGATTESVVGMPEAEGRDFLDRLLDWSTQPQFVLRHQWQVGDLVVWDNTGMLHRALPYDATSRRLLHRTTLVGEQAVA